MNAGGPTPEQLWKQVRHEQMVSRFHRQTAEGHRGVGGPLHPRVPPASISATSVRMFDRARAVIVQAGPSMRTRRSRAMARSRACGSRTGASLAATPRMPVAMIRFLCASDSVFRAPGPKLRPREDTMFTKDLSGNVPLYGQEMCYWCGAASAQMSRNGYPNPADRLFYTQLDLWNSIQANNSTAPADTGWATDPHGLQGCLQSAANPAGVHWSEFANTSRDTLLFSTLYWMNRREFTAPTLVNQGGHWVVIVGWTTDVEPIAGSSPVLQSIHFHDPEPHNIGTDTTMTAAQWYAGPWNGAVMYSGTWLNEYIAIVEPPVIKGKAQVKQAKRTGGRVLTPAQAVAAARRWISAWPRCRSTVCWPGRVWSS
jgi:hypothetical protein